MLLKPDCIPCILRMTITSLRKLPLDEAAVKTLYTDTLLNRCSSKVNDLVRQSDLIISKGGGNFDTLDEQSKHLAKNISFLLLSKCYPYCNHFDTKLYQPILANFF
jgi:uncharacterized protein with ATP-grasp and redox domains